MPIGWSDDLAIGIAEIDDQHRQLFEAIARLHDARRYGELARVAVTLDFLERYVGDHFAAEERWMADTRFPGAKQHVELHRDFVDEFLRRRDEYLANGPTPALVRGLSEWLEAWLRDHVAGADVELGEFLATSRSSRL